MTEDRLVLTRAVELIARERQRQIDVEGYTPRHDYQHADELALAGASYALAVAQRTPHMAAAIGLPQQAVPPTWPWHASYWKPEPENRVRELVKAGALIATAIDARLNEAAEAQASFQRTYGKPRGQHG